VSACELVLERRGRKERKERKDIRVISNVWHCTASHVGRLRQPCRREAAACDA